MERPCYQCALVIEDFVTFCPQCRAPQIRVLATAPIPQPATLAAVRAVKLPGQARIDWLNALPSVILGMLVGALIAVVSRGPILGLLLCGILSVVFYRQRNNTIRITRWVGARLGAFSGALGLGIIVCAVRAKFTLNQLAPKALQMTLEQNPDPATRQKLLDLSSQHPQAFLASLILAAISLGIIFLIISSLGGIIGASLMNRWRPQINLTSSDKETKLEQREKTERSEHD